MRWLRDWWWARQRKIDIAILWPCCKEVAFDVTQARQAFMQHALRDPAWIEHYGYNGLEHAVEELT